MAAGFLPGLPFRGDALPAALDIVLGIVSNNGKTTAFLTKTAVSRNGKRLLYIFLTVPSIAWMPLRGKSRTVPMLCQFCAFAKNMSVLSFLTNAYYFYVMECVKESLLNCSYEESISSVKMGSN